MRPSLRGVRAALASSLLALGVARAQPAADPPATEPLPAEPAPPESVAPESVPPAPPEAAPAEAGAAVLPPRVITRVPADYPASARHAGHAGRVLLSVTIDADGAVGTVEVAESVSPELDAAAARAVREWKFLPALRDGIPVAARIAVPFDFEAPPPEPAAPPPSGPAEPAVLERGAEVVVQGRASSGEPRSVSDFALARDLVHAAPHHEGVDVLRVTPGLYIARPEGAAVAHRYMLRGFDSEHGQDIEFKVAGFPINLPSHLHGQGYADLGFLIGETVDELRITEGVHDPRQGDFAVAGSIDIRLGVARRGVLSRTSYGSFGTFRQLALWAPEEQARDSFAAVAYQSTRGFGQNRRGASASAVIQHGFSLDDWRLRVAAIFHGARASMAGVLRRDDVEAGRAGFYDVYPLATARAQNALSMRGLLGLFGEYRGMAGESSEFGLWLGYDRFRIQQNFTGFLSRSRSLANVSGRGDLIEQRNRSFSLGASGRYHSPAFELLELIEGHVDVGLSSRIDDIEQAQNLLDAAVRNQVWDERIDASIAGLDVGLFGDLDLHWTEALQLRLGMRAAALSYDVDDRLGNFAPLLRPDDAFIPGFRRSAFGSTWGPRASVDVRPYEPLVLHASYGEGYRSPQARTLEDGERTPFTKVRSSDLGVRWRAGDLLEASLGGYYTRLSDDVAFEASEGRLERVGATRRMGGVLHAQARPWRGAVAALSVTYVDAELIEPPPATDADPDPPFERGQNLPYVPPWVVRADVGVTRELADVEGAGTLSVRGGLGFSALSARPLPFAARAEPLAIFDVSLAAGLGPVELAFEVFNFLDARYASLEYSFVSAWDPAAPGSRLPARHLTAGAPRTLLATLEIDL